MTRLRLLLLLYLQGTPAENPLAPDDLPAGPVLLLSLTYTRENRAAARRSTSGGEELRARAARGSSGLSGVGRSSEAERRDGAADLGGGGGAAARGGEVGGRSGEQEKGEGLEAAVDGARGVGSGGGGQGWVRVLAARRSWRSDAGRGVADGEVERRGWRRRGRRQAAWKRSGAEGELELGFDGSFERRVRRRMESGGDDGG